MYLMFMSCACICTVSPNVICWTFIVPQCFPWMWLGGWAPSHRETVYIPHCFHLSPVRALYLYSVAYDCESQIIARLWKHPLIYDNEFALPFCTVAYSIYGFDLITNLTTLLIYLWLPGFWPLNKRQQFCISLVCVWFQSRTVTRTV